MRNDLSDEYGDDLFGNLSEETLRGMENDLRHDRDEVKAIENELSQDLLRVTPGVPHDDVDGLSLNRFFSATRPVLLREITPTPIPESARRAGSHDSSTSTSRAQPLRWDGDQVGMSEGSIRARTILLEGLRQGIDEHEFSKRLLSSDEADIREGVDLVVAGLLHQRREESAHARRLRDALRFLTITRDLTFSLNHRFIRLADLPPTQIGVPLSLPPPPPLEQTDEAIVRRVWGDDFRQKLGLTGPHDILRPLARLAVFAETLNQDVARIARFLDQYRTSRLKVPRRGLRKHITKNDVHALANDLKNIIMSNQRQYTSVVTPNAVSQSEYPASGHISPG